MAPSDDEQAPPPDSAPDAAGGFEDPTTLRVARARDGDSKSVEWLIDRFTPLILSIANYRLGKRFRELYDPEDRVNNLLQKHITGKPRKESAPKDDESKGALDELSAQATTIVGIDHKVLAAQSQRALENLHRKLPGSVFNAFQSE